MRGEGWRDGSAIAGVGEHVGGARTKEGMPVATALSIASDLPAVFVRKVAKVCGTAKFAEGPGVDGRRVLIVEDVVMTGCQIVLSAQDVRACGPRCDPPSVSSTENWVDPMY